MDPIDGLTDVPVAVAGTPPVTFALDADAGDPVAAWMLANGWIDEPVQRMFLGLVRPGMRVLDLGCHIGTFSLPAAGLGAEVLAVDAATRHVEIVRAAAARNGFSERLHVEHAALAAADGEVAFRASALHGRLWRDGIDPDDDEVVRLPARTVDGLLAARGWDGVDLIKMDIEGAELQALAGMAQLHAAGHRPLMVLECNATTLPLLGTSITALRGALAALGYRLWTIDHLRPGTIVETLPDAVQPEAVTDLLAAPALPDTVAAAWRVEPPFTVQQTLGRVLDVAADPSPGYRVHAARLLADGPPWLTESQAAAVAREALAGDEAEELRAAIAPGREISLAAHEAGTPRPDEDDGLPAGMVVWADRAALTAGDEPEHLGAPPEDALRVRDLSFHLRPGQLLAVLADDARAATLLLRGLAGRIPAAAGVLELARPAVLLAQVAEGLEPAMTVRDNVSIFSAFTGGAVPRTEAELAEVAGRLEITGQLERPLRDVAPAVVARLALGVALRHGSAELLLVDELGGLADAGALAWAREETARRRGEGLAVVQVVRDERDLLGAPTRVLWLDEGRVRACGHPGSVLDAARRARLGLALA